MFYIICKKTWLEHGDCVWKTENKNYKRAEECFQTSSIIFERKWAVITHVQSTPDSYNNILGRIVIPTDFIFVK